MLGIISRNIDMREANNHKIVVFQYVIAPERCPQIRHWEFSEI